MQDFCVLVPGKFCNNCGMCNRCDLNPEKTCDNCMECLKSNADYNAILIEEILEDIDNTDADYIA